MYFFDKLRLLELLRQDDVTTYRAADKTTGQDYLFHWLPPDNNPQLERIMNLLNGLDGDARKLIVEVGRRYNRPYLITQNTPTFSDLESWLHAVKNFAGASSLEKKGAWKISAEFHDQKAPSPVPPSASEPGEFTRLMQKLPVPVSAPPAHADAIISPQAPPPGEFTLFMRQSESPATPPPAPPAPKPAAPAGEFTRMMQANPAPAQPQPQPQPERVMRPGPRPETGEFTRLFRLPNTADSGSRTAPPPVNPSPPPQPPQPAQPGEFTRMFQSPVTQPTPLLPREDPFHQPYQPPAEAPSEFSRNFGPQPQAVPELFSHASERATQVFARPAPPPEPVPRVPEGPGEYTRMFGAPAVPAGSVPPPAPVSAPVHAAPSAPATAAAPQPRPKSKPDSGLLIFVGILAVLAVCAIGLIVYFALKK